MLLTLNEGTKQVEDSVILGLLTKAIEIQKGRKGDKFEAWHCFYEGLNKIPDGTQIGGAVVRLVSHVLISPQGSPEQEIFEAIVGLGRTGVIGIQESRR